MKGKICLTFLVMSLIFLNNCTERNESALLEDRRSANPNGRLDSWSYTGPGGGGAMFSPTLSPHDPNFAFVSCDMTGSYLTKNGGQSWRMFNLRGVVRFYVFDPNDSEVIYARSSALFKSRDGGDTWEVLYPPPAEIKGIISKGDHASEIIVTQDSTLRTVWAMAVDPEDTQKLYAAIEIDHETFLFTSEKGGTGWSKKMVLKDDVKNIFVDPSSPADNRKIYVTAKTGVLTVEGDQHQWNRSPEGVELITSFAGGYSADRNKFIIYAIAGKSYFNPSGDRSGIFISTDAGKSWENRQEGLVSKAETGTELPEWRAIATCQNHPEVIYVSYANLNINEDTTYIGVAKSEDYGETWELVWKDNVGLSGQQVGSNFISGWLNERFGPGWGENPFAIGVAPNNPDICFTTDFGRTVKTMDGGESWEQVYTRKKEGGGWTSTGLQVTTNYMLAFDPSDTSHILMANTDTGLMGSCDGGESWTSATNNNGVPRAWYNSTYWVAFDPAVKNKVWAVMSRNHDLPRPKMWRNGGVDRYMGGVLASENAGKNWVSVSGEIGEGACTHILIDPDSNPEARTLYVCVFGKGVYKSTDGGKSWIQKNKGITGDEPFAWRITRRKNDGDLFLVVSRRSDDGSIGNDGDGALYRSDDEAESWIRMTLPEGTNGPTSLAIDSDKPERILLSAWGRPINGTFSPDTGGGIFISENDGITWQQAMDVDQHIHDITIDERNNVYYACGFNASAYRSEDRGNTWERIQGYNFKWGKRVEPDPFDPDKIYIITFGGGVWYGPAKGDPEAKEDIITPALTYEVIP